MIINKIGGEYSYGVITYRIGDRVYANDQSSYNGLYGEIIEICTEQEKGTDNEGPDIVCWLNGRYSDDHYLADIEQATIRIPVLGQIKAP